MPDDRYAPMMAWLREQIDEDKRAIADLTKPTAEPLLSSRRDVHEWVTEVSLRPKPGVTRVLREIEAKRQIIAEHGRRDTWANARLDDDTDPVPICITCAVGSYRGSVPWPCPTLLALFPIYADRPGFREEWRP